MSSRCNSTVEDYAAWLMNNEVDSWDEMLKQVISEAEQHKGGIRFEPAGSSVTRSNNHRRMEARD